MFPNDLSPEEEKALTEPFGIEEFWPSIFGMLFYVGIVWFIWWLVT